MNYTFATVVIPDVAKGEALVDLGEGFFASPLSATGEEPATHWMSSGPFNNDEMNTICNEAVWPKFIYFGQDWQAALESQKLKLVIPAE